MATINTALDTGTATSVGASSITNTGKSYTTDVHRFGIVWLTNGAHSGAIGFIKSNTGTVLALVNFWWLYNSTTKAYEKVTPTGTPTYAIGHQPQNLVASFPAEFAYAHEVSGADLKNSILAISDNDLLVASGGFFGSWNNPSIDFQFEFRGFNSDNGSNIVFGKLDDTGERGMNGGRVVHCLSYNAPSTGGKYASGIYHVLKMHGKGRFFGTSFESKTDFIFDASVGATNRRNRYFNNAALPHDGVVMLDCKFESHTFDNEPGDVFKNCKFFDSGQAQWAGNTGVGNQYLEGSNLSIAGTNNPNGFTVANVEISGKFDATKRIGKPLFLFSWDTALGGACAYLKNFYPSNPFYSATDNDILKAMNFDTAGADATPNGTVWLGYGVDLSVKDASGNALSGVTIGCKDKFGNAGWFNSKGASYPYTPSMVASRTTDTNGLVLDASVIKGRIKWRGVASPNDWGAWFDANSPVNPWTVEYRKYGFVFQTFTKNWKNQSRNAQDETTFAVNPYTVANEATAAGYSSRFSINWTTRVITVTGTATPQQMYDYTQYAAALSANIGHAPLMTAVSPGVFDMGTTRIVVASGGTLTTDENNQIKTGNWGDNNVALTVNSGGVLTIGTSATRGRCLDFGKTLTGHANTESNYSEDWASIRINSGGTLNWNGGDVQSHFPVAFMEGAIIRIASQICKLTNEGLQVTAASAIPQIRQRANNVEIDGLTAFGFILTIVGNATRFNNYNVSNAQMGILPSLTSPSNTWLLFKGADLSNNVVRQNALYASKWMRFSNNWDGSNMTAESYAANGTLNKGISEIRQEINFTLPSGSGAKVYTKDTSHGLRLAANQVGTNPSYTTDREYLLTESGGSASYTTDGGVLIGVHYNSLGGVMTVNDRFDSRGINNNKTDIFRWLKVQYGYQPATLDVVMKGTSAVQSSIAQLLDLGITQANRATVAAYTGITPVYSGGVLTVTVSSNKTWNEVYDYIKYWESENPSAVWSNNKSSFVSTSSKLGYDLTNCVIVVSNATVTMADGQSLPTNPTVTGTGKFISNSIVLFYDGADLLKLAKWNGQLKDAITSANIEGVAIGFGDEDTQTELLYNASFTKTGLETDSEGKASGYLAFQKGATVYTNLKQVFGEYEYNFAIVPRTLNGTAIGSSATPEITRLSPDTQVTKTKADALLVSGVSVTHATKKVDGGGNTLTDIYDNLKARQASIDDIEAGIPGCMSYCLFGAMLTKAGNNYSGQGDWDYEDITGTGTFATGTYVLASAEVPSFTIGTLTLEFSTAGSYNYATVTFVGTVDFKNASGGAVTVQVQSGVDYARSGSPLPTVIEPLVYQSVTINGLATGQRIFLRDETSDTVLANDIVSGTSFTWTDDDPATDSREILLRLSYVDGDEAMKFIEQIVGTAGITMGTRAVSVQVSTEDDTIYNGNAINGQTALAEGEVTFTDASVDVMNMDISTGTMSLQKLYAIWVAYAFTEAGIATDIDYIRAIDGANYEYTNLKWKNITSPMVPLKITGGYAWDSTTKDPIDLIDNTGGTIFLTPPHVVNNIVTVSGSSVITGDISDLQPDITAIKANTEKDLSYISGNIVKRL